MKINYNLFWIHFVHDKPANNFCLWLGHLSGQRPVLTGQEASLVGQKSNQYEEITLISERAIYVM